MTQKEENIKRYGKANLDKKGNIIYPIDLKNKKEYASWLESKVLHDILKSQSIIETSEGFKVDVNVIRKSKLQRDIIDLPEDEKKEILKRWQEISRARGKTFGLYSKTFHKKNAFATKSYIDELNEREVEVISLFSKLYSSEEVHKIVRNQLGIKVTKEAIYKFRSKHAEEIRIAQEKYKEGFDGIRLVNKRSRLEELLDLYNDRRDIYQTGKGQNDYRLLLQTLEHIRKEVEGDRVTVDASLQIKIEHTINLQQEEVLRELPVKTMIISMVAGRLGINPLQLLTRLTNSYYAKFNGMTGSTPVFNSSDIIYPSQLIYNLDEIKALSIENTKKDLELTEYEEVNEKEEKVLIGAKGSLLEKLRAKKKDLRNRKNEDEAVSKTLFKEESKDREKNRKNIVK